MYSSNYTRMLLWPRFRPGPIGEDHSVFQTSKLDFLAERGRGRQQRDVRKGKGIRKGRTGKLAPKMLGWVCLS